MKWISATLSFLFVSAGVFFIAGWCLLPAPLIAQAEQSRLERVRLLGQMDWGNNGWGFALGPLCGSLSAWLTIRKGNRQSGT